MPKPKVARISHLKRVREKLGMTVERLSERLEVAPAEVKRWEKDLGTAALAQLRDLAVVLGVTVQSLRGEEPDSSVDPDFAIDRQLDVPYGTLRLVFGTEVVEYPVDQKERESVLGQLYGCGPQEEGDDGTWLYFGTLDNLIVFANTEHVQRAELVSDDAEEMPDFSHPEVYQALEDWDCGSNEYGPVVTGHCDLLVEAHGYDQAIQRARNVRILAATGGESWHHLVNEADTAGIFELELEATSGIARNRFMRTSIEGYHVEKFVNLSQTALVEVPANQYLRLINTE